MTPWMVGVVVYMLVMAVAYTVRLLQIEREYRRAMKSLRDFAPRERVLDLTSLRQVTFEDYAAAIFAQEQMPTEVHFSPAGWESFMPTLLDGEPLWLVEPLDFYRYLRERGLVPYWAGRVRLTVPEVDRDMGIRTFTDSLEQFGFTVTRLEYGEGEEDG